jgi:hypothetical protein
VLRTHATRELELLTGRVTRLEVAGGQGAALRLRRHAARLQPDRRRRRDYAPAEQRQDACGELAAHGVELCPLIG